jgi:hypothetical protein
MGALLTTQIKACFHTMKHPSSPSTKKFKVTPSARKVMLTVFWDSQEVLLAHFQKCSENLNSASYCEVLLKLRDAISRKRPGQLVRGVLLYHDNSRPHTARATQEIFQELQWEFPEHQSYSPDLAPSDFHLFGLLKNHMANISLMTKRLKRRCEVDETTIKRLLCCGFLRIGKAMRRVSMLVEDMSRNKCFFQVRISRFTFYTHLWPIYWLPHIMEL